VIQAGRVVVKNVAGYDITKLFVGSHGTLGLMADATLKLIPKPRAQRTLVIPVDSIAQGLGWGEALLPSLLVASGLVLCPGRLLTTTANAPYALIVTAEGVTEDVESELAEIVARLRNADAPTPVANTATSSEAWATFIGTVQPTQLLARSGVPTKTLGAYLAQVAPVARTEWFVDLAHGLAYATTTTTESKQAQQWLTALRQPALTNQGYTVLMQTPPTLTDQLDTVGYPSTSRTLMQQLKQRWDPQGVLPAL